MYLRSSIKHSFSLLAILLFLTACGGGGGGGGGGSFSESAPVATNIVPDSDNPYSNDAESVIPEITGQFIDGPVAGLTYLCSSGMSGVTNVNGEFTCKEGNIVTFKVGSVVLGTALTDSVITPATLHSNDTQAAINVARLLQSLDDDGDLSTIMINKSDANKLDASLDVTADTFEADATQMMTKTLVSEDAALEHLNINLAALASADDTQLVKPLIKPGKPVKEPESTTLLTLLEESVAKPVPTPTPDTSTPVADSLTFIDISTINISNTSAQINFIMSDFAQGQVEYGTTTAYGRLTTKETSFNYKDHTQSLNSLEAGTTYHYRILATDREGKSLISGDLSFITTDTLSAGAADQAAAAEAAAAQAAADQAAAEAAAAQAAACPNGSANHEGRVTDTTGVGLAGVEVSIGGCYTTTTDAEGYYEIPNIPANDRAAVTFRKDGYYPNTAIILIEQYLEDTTTLSSNYLEFALDKYASWNPWTFDSQTGASGGAVEIPASACKNISGTEYQGTVTANWIFVDTMTSKGRDAFPGNFEGRSTEGVIVPFVSYGFMLLELEDENGAALNVSANINFILTSVTGTTEQHIPLWYFDDVEGIWIEEGYATRQSDGKYLGTVSHPGTWSLNSAISTPPATYKGKIVHTDSSPAKDVRVYAVGENWISSDLSTDAEGNFEISVVPESSFTLKAYNYKDKYEALYEGTLPAIASGEISG